MGWLGKSEYNCPECDGEREVICTECGTEVECDRCDGTGWDPEQVDIAGFKAACESLNEKMLAHGSWGSCEWIDRKTNTRLGRDGEKHGQVAVADFLIGKAQNPACNSGREAVE